MWPTSLVSLVGERRVCEHPSHEQWPLAHGILPCDARCVEEDEEDEDENDHRGHGGKGGNTEEGGDGTAEVQRAQRRREEWGESGKDRAGSSVPSHQPAGDRMAWE